MITITGTYEDPSAPGKPASGTVTLALDPEDRDASGVQRTHGPLTATLNGSGTFVLTVPDDFSAGLSQWHVTENVSGLRRVWTLVLDPATDTGTVDLPSRYPGVDTTQVAVLPLPGPTGPPPVLVDGTTVTLPPGSQATSDVRDLTAGTYALDFGIPAGVQGETGAQGIQGPPGPTGSVVYQWRQGSGTDADVDPGTGNVVVESTGGANRRLAISETDMGGTVRALGALKTGDTITVGWGGPPATGVVAYTIVQAPVDMGTWWKFETVRQALVGVSPPATGTTLNVYATYGTGELFVPTSKIGNLLTDNQASVETDTTGIQASFATISADAAAAMVGTKGLKMVSTGTNHFGVYIPASSGATAVPVVGGRTYTAVFSMKAPVATNGVIAYIYWFKADGSAASQAYANGTAVMAAVAEKQMTLTAVAPADAVTASLRISVQSPSGAGVEVHADRIGFWEGAGGQWAMPGTAIQGLGRRVTHPNTDDVLVEEWDDGKGRWQTQHYDSGWRDVTSLISAAGKTKWPNSTMYVRRQNASIQYIFFGGTGSVDGAGTTSVWSTGSQWKPATPGSRGPIGSAINASNGQASPHGYYGSSGGINVGTTTSSADNIQCSLIAFTDASIPTTLPGTLVSPAPY